jgi:hypothetical protein
MNTPTQLTPIQESEMMDFINTSFTNGLHDIAAYLSSNHPYIRNNKVSQIRTIKNVLAKGYDELGNEIRLTRDLRIIQD